MIILLLHQCLAVYHYNCYIHSLTYFNPSIFLSQFVNSLTFTFLSIDYFYLAVYYIVLMTCVCVRV